MASKNVILANRTLREVDIIRAELARRHLLDYCVYDNEHADEPYVIAAHHKIIAEQLEKTLEEVADIKFNGRDPNTCSNLRVGITLPPRHGKSRLCSVEYPAWVLSKYPNLNMIMTSYSAGLIEGFSGMAKEEAFRKQGLFTKPGERLLNKPDGNRSIWSMYRHNWGGMIATSIGGPITGRGADIAIIDDPLRNYDEAKSEVMRSRVINWYQTTLRTRLSMAGAVIIVMTRWHEDDLVGNIKSSESKAGDSSEGWKWIDLPALAEENDPMGREVGEALWPSRYSREYLLKTKAALSGSYGSFFFDSLYQQHPSSPSGVVFKKEFFKYFDVQDGVYVLFNGVNERRAWPIDECWHFMTVDPVATAKATSNYFVASTWVVTPENDLLLFEVIRKHKEPSEQVKTIISSYNRNMPSYVGIETNGIGAAPYQMLRDAGVPVKELRAKTDKVTRSLAISARYESGKVYHKINEDWLKPFEDELLAFPTGRYDDQVDTASYAGILLADISLNAEVNAVVDFDVVGRISQY